MDANYPLLAKIHFWLGLLSFFLFGIPTFTADLTESGKVYLPLTTVIFPSLHFTIAYACKIKSNKGRVASRIVGFCFMPFFPVGTILGFALYENSKRKFQAIST
ncbi:hypothetical protein [Planctobacterium marinum]|uniref:hypothetical protein n=1 Tax=Planctobacterium marinum TaxID=1631968 RepID=UPI001E4D8693|nr:hypothetical protein [Planctobacterium marinum]MCC2608188.1 hypothetical protein [Planctobacterium marinum]